MESVDAEQEKLRLEKVYAGMGDDQLLHVAEDIDGLTDVAREAISAEMERRELSLPESNSPEDTEVNLALMTATAAVFQSHSEALLAQGLLNSAGIKSILVDDRTALTWIGASITEGFRLKVAEEDVSTAEEILKQITAHPLEESSSDFDISQHASEEKIESYHPSECPICHSSEIFFTASDAAIINTLDVLGAIIDISRGSIPTHSTMPNTEAFWNCRDCGSKWQGPKKQKY